MKIEHPTKGNTMKEINGHLRVDNHDPDIYAFQVLAGHQQWAGAYLGREQVKALTDELGAWLRNTEHGLCPEYGVDPCDCHF